MNLPNKITLSRIMLVPIILIFIIPLPKWMLSGSDTSFLHQQLLAINDFIIHYGNYIGAIIFIIIAYTDKVDGYIARKRNLQTKFGAFIDPIADKLLISATLIALAERKDITSWAAIIIISREIIITGFRLIAAGEGIVLPADRWGKLKMKIQCYAIAFVLLKNYPLSLLTNIPFDRYLMGAAILITIYSGYNYISKNRKVFGGSF